MYYRQFNNLYVQIIGGQKHETFYHSIKSQQASGLARGYHQKDNKASRKEQDGKECEEKKQMNKKAPNQDEIEKMLADLCDRPLPENLTSAALVSLLHLVFGMGKQWEACRRDKLCLCPRSVDCYDESDGRCTHL